MDDTAEEQSHAIIGAFNNSGHLLDEWCEMTAEMYPDDSELLSKIPNSADMCKTKAHRQIYKPKVTEVLWHDLDSMPSHLRVSCKIGDLLLQVDKEYSSDWKERFCPGKRNLPPICILGGN